LQTILDVVHYLWVKLSVDGFALFLFPLLSEKRVPCSKHAEGAARDESWLAFRMSSSDSAGLKRSQGSSLALGMTEWGAVALRSE
jgi:hypothetical protein